MKHDIRCASHEVGAIIEDCNCGATDREVPLSEVKEVARMLSHGTDCGSHDGWACDCHQSPLADREAKRIVLSSLHETRFGLWALDANGQVYDVAHETMFDEDGNQHQTASYTLTKVTFVDPKEGK